MNLQINNEKLIIIEPTTGEILAKHTISLEKGKLIKNTNHARDHTESLDMLKQRVLHLFPTGEASRQYIDEICQRYKRYRRDQLLILQRVAENDPHWIPMALEKCIREKLYSANAFQDVVNYLKLQESNPILEIQVNSTKLVSSIAVETRDFNTYIQRMGGKTNE